MKPDSMRQHMLGWSALEKELVWPLFIVLYYLVNSITNVWLGEVTIYNNDTSKELKLCLCILYRNICVGLSDFFKFFLSLKLYTDLFSQTIMNRQRDYCSIHYLKK